MFLNGVDLELKSILIDEIEPDYELVTDGIKLNNLNTEFSLEIKTIIYPAKNTSLEGLYKSNNIFCTQCEAHGFRRITYYLDRPDVLSVFKVNIKANTDKYPVLLSNGDLIKQTTNEVSYLDKIPKPSYLFALVAGDLAVLEDSYITKSNKKVVLKIYVEHHNIQKTKFAMSALKRAFAWDEKRFGLEYDLSTYMIVAVDDFNMGAMENKGLNIFNSSYVLADYKTATDEDFIDIEAVIGHEYFHNWTGNRVTCRDWFQLSLKEGLTVFRDQEFTSDIYSRSIKRIEDVRLLRTFQFAEDAGPMRHPVRLESYVEMRNFYTCTIYEKGAELIRMIHTFLTEEGFQKGMKLYFKRHDGNAVTIDDFIASMSDANNFDFTNFMNWYSTSGTPNIDIYSNYEANNQTFKLSIKQKSAHIYHFPIKFALLDNKGKELESGILEIKNKEQDFIFDNIQQEPTPSILRGFSAPIKLKSNLNLKQRIFLIEKDSDAFNRWDNIQKLWLDLILNEKTIDQDLFFLALKKTIKNTKDNSLLKEMLTLPSERFIQQQQKIIDVFAIHNARENLILKISKKLQPIFLDIYNKLNTNKTYSLTKKDIGNRGLKNICLYYLVKNSEFELAFNQFKNANCMSDKLASFNALVTNDNKYKKIVIDEFYNEFKNDVQVMDKWFQVQAIAPTTDVNEIKKLMKHPLFNFNNPNRLRSVVGAFTSNYINFHNKKGYDFFTSIIIKLNKSNSQIGARMTSVYNHWRKFSNELSILQKQQLEHILTLDDLSNDISEIAKTALK